MLRLCTKILFCITALCIGLPAQAEIIFLKATLIRSEEPVSAGGDQPTLTCPNPGPPCGGPPLFGGVAPRDVSFGTATFVLDTVLNFMTMTVIVTNIDVTGTSAAGTGTQTPGDQNDDLVAAHIHVGSGLPGQSTSPVRWGFFGTPFNNTIENNPTDGDMTPFGPGLVGGTFTGVWDATEGNGTVSPGVPVTLINQKNDILAGLAYINYHTAQFPGGEIRGQILVVPEPGTLALLGLGLLGLAGLRRRFA